MEGVLDSGEASAITWGDRALAVELLTYVVRTTAIYAKVDRKPYASGRDPQLTATFRRASQASSRWRPTMQARVSSDVAVPRPSFASS